MGFLRPIKPSEVCIFSRGSLCAAFALKSSFQIIAFPLKPALSHSSISFSPFPFALNGTSHYCRALGSRELISFPSIQDQDKKLQDLWRICQKLPKHNLANFR